MSETNSVVKRVPTVALLRNAHTHLTLAASELRRAALQALDPDDREDLDYIAQTTGEMLQAVEQHISGTRGNNLGVSAQDAAIQAD